MAITFEDEDDSEEELTFGPKPKTYGTESIRTDRPTTLPLVHGTEFGPPGASQEVLRAVAHLVELVGLPDKPNQWYQLSFYVRREPDDPGLTIHGLALYLHRGAKA